MPGRLLLLKLTNGFIFIFDISQLGTEKLFYYLFLIKGRFAV